MGLTLSFVYRIGVRQTQAIRHSYLLHTSSSSSTLCSNSQPISQSRALG